MKAWSLHLALSANQSDIPRKALMLIFMISLKQTYFIRLMSGLPRFSHGSDFSKLASSEQEEQTDYVVGILAVSFFIISLFIFWAALIIACKCMGKRRVGLCAGRMRFECDEKGQFYPPSYAWKLRFTFVVLGCCMFLLCLTLAGPGLVKVMTTSESVRKLSRDVNDLTTQGLVILDSLERVKRNIDGSDVLSIPRMEEACPKSNIIVSIDADFDHVNEYIQKSYLERIRQHIDFIIDETEHIEKAVTTFEENDWIVKMFALFLGGLIIFMIFAAFYEWSGSCQYLFALTCMLELFILPTFVLAIACCWVATSALAFASIFNSGNLQQSGPAGTLMQMFEERGITSDHMVFTAFAYYQSGCVTEDPIIQLYKYEDYIQSGIGLADQFLTKANGVGIDEINEFCGADVTPFIERIGLIKVSLELLLGALRSLVELASCSKMSALYKLVFEELACTDARVTFELLFLIMFAISLLGMVLVMLRAGMYPLKIVFPSSSLDEEKNELEEYRAYLQYVSSFINSWGGNMDNDVSLSPTVITSETSSESTSSSVNLELGNSPTIISPSGPVPRSFHKAQVLDCTSMCENKEIIPLSPPESRFTFDESRIMYAPDAIETSRGDSSEYTPLTPHTSSAHSSDKRRFTTPDSPSVVSAIRQQAWVNCFSNFVSPSRIGNHCGDKSE